MASFRYMSVDNPKSRYDIGDIHSVFSDKRIQRTHCDLILHPVHEPRTSSGHKVDGPSRKALNVIKKYRFERVNASQYIRNTTDIDGNITNSELLGDFYLVRDAASNDHIITSKVGSYANPIPEFVQQLSASLGITLASCQITKIRGFNGTYWRQILATDDQGNSVDGLEFREERSKVARSVERKLAANRFGIYGSEGSEVWFGGVTDLTQVALDRLKILVNQDTPHRFDGLCPSCGREHKYWPAGHIEVKHFLFTTVADFTDEEADDLLAPTLETIPSDQLILDREGNDISNHIANLRRYPEYDPRTGKILKKQNKQKIELDLVDVNPLPEDKLLRRVKYGHEEFQWNDETGEISIKRKERDINRDLSDPTLLDDLQETYARVTNKNIKISKRIAGNQMPVSNIFGNREWNRDKEQPVRSDVKKLKSKKLGRNLRSQNQQDR